MYIERITRQGILHNPDEVQARKDTIGVKCIPSMNVVVCKSYGAIVRDCKLLIFFS